MGINQATANPAALAPCFEVSSFRAARGGRGAAARPRLAPQSPRRAGGRRSAARGARLAPSLLPALPGPGATPALPGRQHEQGRLARPARRAPDKGRKEAGTNRGEEATAARLPPASAAAASVCAQPGPTLAAGEVTRRAPSEAGEPEGTGGRSGGGRRREERGWWLTRIRLKRLLSLGGSGTDGMARAALGQARLAGVGAAREGQLSVRGTGGGGERRGGNARTRRGGGGGTLTHSPAPPALPAGSPGPLCAAAGAPRRPPDAAKWPPGSPRRRRSAAPPPPDTPSVRPPGPRAGSEDSLRDSLRDSRSGG